jgi:LmbE family N-acetylglucosaminyl deacetylase
MMQRLEHIIKKYDIDTCIFHFCDDYQTDHLAANQISKTASRHCQNIMMFQSNPYILTQQFAPTYFVDISAFVEKKIEALSQYDAEHNRQGNLFETNITRNQLWGYGTHTEYAEGFMVIKMVV